MPPASDTGFAKPRPWSTAAARAERDVHRARDVAIGEFLGFADVDDRAADALDRQHFVRRQFTNLDLRGSVSGLTSFSSLAAGGSWPPFCFRGGIVARKPARVQ
jgi:hypothetical protein